jgi:hypothetical protein
MTGSSPWLIVYDSWCGAFVCLGQYQVQLRFDADIVVSIDDCEYLLQSSSDEEG